MAYFKKKELKFMEEFYTGARIAEIVASQIKK